MQIGDTKIGPTRVYWVEGIFPRQWQIKSYQMESGSIEDIQESLTGETSTMAPRLDSDGDTLVWMEGYENRSGYLHNDIYSFAPDKGINRIALVHDIHIPYNIIRIRNNVISFSDIINGNWAIRIININSNQENRVFFDKKPSRPVSDGKTLVWEENGKLYYIQNIKNPACKRYVDEKIFLFDLHKGDIVYTKTTEGHHVYTYYTKLGVNMRLT